MRRAAAEARTLDKADGLDGLTSKQQLFVSYVFAGMTDSEAYRQAYQVQDMTEGSVRAAAHVVRHDHNVTLKLRELQDKRDEKTTLALSLTREWILQRLMNLADNATKETVQVTSLIALGKVAGVDLFRETTRTEHITRTVEDIDRELVTHLKALQPMIEGNAVEVTGPTVANDRRRKPGDGRPKIKP